MNWWMSYLNIERFLSGYLNLLLEARKDSQFETLRVMLQGLSGIRTAKLLNFASLCMEATHEYYCEIGTFRGYTLASAGYENRSMVVGIDNARPEWCAPEVLALEQMPKRLMPFEGLNYKFINQDFRGVRLEPYMAVLFIDGNHTGKEVTDALNWAKPLLVKDAIIVFDDVAVRDVGEAILSWCQSNPSDELVFYSKAFDQERIGCVTNPYLANGIAIMRHKEPAHA